VKSQQENMVPKEYVEDLKKALKYQKDNQDYVNEIEELKTSMEGIH